MTSPAKLRAIKTAALKWVDAKRALEAYANNCALSGQKTDQQKLSALTLAYGTAELGLETLAIEDEAPALKRAVGRGA